MTQAAITELIASSTATLLKRWREATVTGADKAYVDSIREAEAKYRSTCIPETSRTTEAAERQYLREPSQAICDSTVSINIPGVFKDYNLEVSRSFNILTPPSGPTGKQIPTTSKAASPMDSFSEPTENTPAHIDSTLVPAVFQEAGTVSTNTFVAHSMNRDLRQGSTVYCLGSS